MFLLDYGDEPIKVLDSGCDLLPTLNKTYHDGVELLKVAKKHPGAWFRTSPFSWFCYVEAEKSPFRT